eukprot:g37561.t1
MEESHSVFDIAVCANPRCRRLESDPTPTSRPLELVAFSTLDKGTTFPAGFPMPAPGTRVPEVKRNAPGKFRHCGNCRLVYYCSNDCQRIDWRNHQQECIGKEARRNPLVSEARRFIAKLRSPYFKHSLLQQELLPSTPLDAPGLLAVTIPACFIERGDGKYRDSNDISLRFYPKGVLQEASALSLVRSAMHLAEKKYAQHLMELASTYKLRETILPSISLAGSSQNLHVHQQQRKQQH